MNIIKKINIIDTIITILQLLSANMYKMLQSNKFPLTFL